MSTSELTVAQAFDQALLAAADDDEDRRWELVSWLHVNGGGQALTVASRLSEHPEPVYRALAADVLGQLGAGPGAPAIDGPFREGALELLLAMAQREHDSAVLNSIAVGFGHIGDERCLETLVQLHTHHDAKVRAGVVFGLLGRSQAVALNVLITLSSDDEPSVRDWATFGLARQTKQDFPRLRDALAHRLTDDDPDTLAEAIHGLALRGDERAIQPLLDALQSPLPVSDPNVLTEALYALGPLTRGRIDATLYSSL
ncbi:HEAT repeat domain-containing protein [Rhizocola hellebori]|nr:HEAT repeat domain-containing protein [Rhizocola hellebori]